MTYFSSWYSASSSFSATTATTINSPASIQCRVNTTDLEQFSAQTLDVTSETSWDFGQAIGRWSPNTTYTSGQWVRPSAAWIADGANNPRTDYATKPMYGSSWNNQVVSATSVNTTYSAYLAFNLEATVWMSNAAPTTEAPQSLMIDRGRAIIINKYAIQARNSSGSVNARAFPKRWTLEGSNSGSSALGDASGANGWVVLHDQSSDATDPGDTTWSGYYTFSNSTAYRYYRIRITDRYGSNNYVAIMELKLVRQQAVAYKCTVAGTSHSTTEPTWPISGTVSDNGIEWTWYPDYTVADKREGTDYYIYSCIPSAGRTPKLLLSANSTYPHGYTALTSRKLGGFHCLCASMSKPGTRANSTAYVIGDTIASGNYWYRCVVTGTSGTNTALGTTIDGLTTDNTTLRWLCEEPHPLYGYVAGDIIPYSVWDLKHRAENHNNQGRVYDPKTQLWVDIYLPSLSGLSAVSVNGGTILDTVTWFKCVDYGLNSSVRMMKYSEFAAAAYGSNEMTNIYGGADPVTTGGHSDTTGRRMVSHIGVEDCCGAMNQWALDTSYQFAGAANHTHTLTLTGEAQTGVATSAASGDVAPAWSYKANTNYHGSLYVQGTYGISKPILGGMWSISTYCGSLTLDANRPPWLNYANYSTRYCCKTKEL